MTIVFNIILLIALFIVGRKNYKLLNKMNLLEDELIDTDLASEEARKTITSLTEDKEKLVYEKKQLKGQLLGTSLEVKKLTKLLAEAEEDANAIVVPTENIEVKEAEIVEKAPDVPAKRKPRKKKAPAKKS